MQTEIIKILKTNTTGHDYFAKKELDRGNLKERSADDSLILKRCADRLGEI